MLDLSLQDLETFCSTGRGRAWQGAAPRIAEHFLGLPKKLFIGAWGSADPAVLGDWVEALSESSGVLAFSTLGCLNSILAGPSIMSCLLLVTHCFTNRNCSMILLYPVCSATSSCSFGRPGCMLDHMSITDQEALTLWILPLPMQACNVSIRSVITRRFC
jgi:hypothetical protein